MFHNFCKHKKMSCAERIENTDNATPAHHTKHKEIEQITALVAKHITSLPFTSFKDFELDFVVIYMLTDAISHSLSLVHQYLSNPID